MLRHPASRPLLLAAVPLVAAAVAGCLPLIGPENEIDWDAWPEEVKAELRVAVPAACATHSLYESGNDALPYAVADQRWMLTSAKDCPGVRERVVGTDLGVSVHFPGGRDDLIYFGDTNIAEDATYKGGPEFYLRDTCAYKGKPRCDDLFGVIRDDNPADGVNVQFQATRWAHLNPRDKIKEWDDAYASIRLLGVNAFDLSGGLKSLRDGNDLFGDFNTPTGAMPIIAYDVASGSDVVFEYGKREGGFGPSELTEAPGVLMAFATASSDYDKKQSWLGCSSDGHTFRSCTYPRESEVTFLSDEKFIQVAPVPFSRDDVDNACFGDPGGVFCDLDAVLADLRPAYGQGALLFGNGHHYRCSPVYLAYFVMATGAVWYYSEALPGRWSSDEEDATAIIEPGYSGYSPRETDICVDPSSDQAEEARKYLFGELSVKLIDGHFVMLSGHIRMLGKKSGFLRVYYRTAPLSSPHRWSAPGATEGVGYGPYILDRYTRIADGPASRYLELYHVVSTWNPTLSPEEPYAVMTRPLRLFETKAAPPWPPAPGPVSDR